MYLAVYPRCFHLTSLTSQILPGPAPLAGMCGTILNKLDLYSHRAKDSERLIPSLLGNAVRCPNVVADLPCYSLQIVAACTEAIKLVLPMEAPRNGIVAKSGHVLLT